MQLALFGKILIHEKRESEVLALLGFLLVQKYNNGHLKSCEASTKGQTLTQEPGRSARFYSPRSSSGVGIFYFCTSKKLTQEEGRSAGGACLTGGFEYSGQNVWGRTL